MCKDHWIWNQMIHAYILAFGSSCITNYSAHSPLDEFLYLCLPLKCDYQELHCLRAPFTATWVIWSLTGSITQYHKINCNYKIEIDQFQTQPQNNNFCASKCLPYTTSMYHFIWFDSWGKAQIYHKWVFDKFLFFFSCN